MKNGSLRPPLKHGEVFFLTIGGIGYSPWAPGTMGSLATLPLLFLLGKLSVPFFIFIPFILILTVGSCFLAQIVQKKWSVKDPSWIVLDEFIGMFVTWFFGATSHVPHLIVAFFLFRLFDIAKPWPVKYFDRMQHAAGVILDDVVAGLLAGLCYFVLHFYFWPLP